MTRLIKDTEIARFMLDMNDMFESNGWESVNEISAPTSLQELLQPSHRLSFVHPDRPDTRVTFTHCPHDTECERFRVEVYRAVQELGEQADGTTTHGIAGFIPHNCQDLEDIREYLSGRVLKG